mgnify:FL=1
MSAEDKNNLFKYVINHKIIDSDETRYFLYKYGELKLLLNGNFPSFDIPKVELTNSFFIEAMDIIEKRFSFFQEGKSEKEWSVFINKLAYDITHGRVKSDINTYSIIWNNSKYCDEYLKHIELHLKKIINGVSLDIVFMETAKKAMNGYIPEMFFNHILINIEKLNKNDLYDAIHKYYPLSEKTKNIPLAYLYLYLYA